MATSGASTAASLGLVVMSGRMTPATLLAFTFALGVGAPHGLTDTHKDQLNADLLAFIKT